MRIKKEMHQKGTIVKEELVLDGDSFISSKQASQLGLAKTCDCSGDCEVCVEAFLKSELEEDWPWGESSHSDEATVAEPVDNISAASTFYFHTVPSQLINSTSNVPASEVGTELQQQVNNDSEENKNNESESEDISQSVIARCLKCRVPGCKRGDFKNKVQLDGHLLAKHATQKYAGKVKDSHESYATRNLPRVELKGYRDPVHVHLGANWSCGHCETTYSNYKKLFMHVYLYHESADKCDYTETTRKEVYQHRPDKNACTSAGCSSSFLNQSNLDIKKKPFLCSQCPKVFTLKGNLTKHQIIHSGTKPFLCSQCPKVFSTKGNLTTHELIHSGRKPFLCSQCPIAFRVKSSLTTHKLSHYGLKQFRCTWPYCGYSASQQPIVIKHVRMVHFHLPKSQKEQTEKGIIDTRDPREYVAKNVITTGN